MTLDCMQRLLFTKLERERENGTQGERDTSKLIERTPPPGGVFYLLCFLIKPCVRDFTTRCNSHISS